MIVRHTSYMNDDSEQCGYETGRGPCENPTHKRHGDNGRCWLESHQPDGGEDTDGRGAPEGNFNGVSSGLDMPTKRRLELFKERGDGLVDIFMDYYVAYRGKAENPREAASLASAAVIRDELEAFLIRDGLTYKKQVGDPDELAAAGEDPAEAFTDMPKSQMLEAYQEARTEVRLGLKYEGINDNATASTTTGNGDLSPLWEGDEAASTAE